MGGGGSSHQVIGQQGPKYNALRVQTSTRGMVIPVVFGTTRIPGNLIWYGDFKQEKVDVTLQRTEYGKGGGGSSYTMEYGRHYYSLAFALALCEGPAEMGAIWLNKFKYSYPPSGTFLFFSGGYPQIPWAHLTVNHPDEALSYPGLAYIGASQFVLADTDSLPNINIEVKALNHMHPPVENLVLNGDMEIGEPPSGWDSDIPPAGFERSSGEYYNGRYSLHFIDNTAGNYAEVHQHITLSENKKYKLSFAYYLARGLMQVYINSGGVEAYPGLSYFWEPGGWKYVEIRFKTGTVSNPSLVFQKNPGVSRINVYIDDVQLQEDWEDANPGEIIEQIIKNERIGLGHPIALDLEAYKLWCLASSLLLSPAYTEQSIAIDVIKELLDHTFSVGVWHDGESLRAVPLADQPITGNGMTYTPDVAAKYDLTDDIFLVDGAEDPITVMRISPAECYNIVKVECLNRASDYNVEPIEVADQGSIDNYYPRPMDAIKAWDICDPDVAMFLAQLKLQRALYIRNEYRFRLPWRYCLLEPTDIVTLTDSKLGMDQFSVMIKEIEDGEDYGISVVAEDYPEGIGQAVMYPRQASGGYLVDHNVNPGDVNDPVIFLAPEELWASPDKPEIWIAVSGAATNWGGCDVHVSSDDSSYGFAGSINSKSRHGTLSATLPVGSDPDEVNTCSVDLTLSEGTLLSGTQLDADNLVTMCAIIDSEIEVISYQTATLTATNKYDLTYLRRGKKGTSISVHVSGSRFVRIDDNVLRLPFESVWMHAPIYFKFCSFNIFYSNKQGLADVDPYTFTIQSQISDILLGTDSIFVGALLSDSGAGVDDVSVSK